MKKNYVILFAASAVYVAAMIASVCVHAQTISTYAGNGTGAFAGDGGAATAASLRYAYNIVPDGTGNMFVADWGNNAIRKITASGTISTIAGNGVPTYGGDGGPATAAYLNQPADIVFDASGNLFFTDNANNRVRKITPSGTITTVVGTGTAGSSGDGGPATAATISDARGIAIDAGGNLYIAEGANHIIRKVTAAGVISTVAGSRLAGATGDGAAATNAKLNNPRDIAIDASGNLYISDNNNHKIRMVNSAGVISTFAGVGAMGFSGDGGPATSARLKYPESVYFDTYGNMYIGDGGNNCVRKIKPSGVISTVAGNGTYSFAGDGGAATAASMKSPAGTTKDAGGNLYIADEGNHRIRKVTPTPITISGSGAVCAGATLSLSASETGGTWSSSATAVATITATGMVTGVAAGSTTISYTESGITGTTVITVNPLPAAISGTLMVCVSLATTLTDTDPGGTWSGGGTSIATIDASGNVTGLGAGNATITYTLSTGCYATATLTVDACPTLHAASLGASRVGVSVYPNPCYGTCTVDIPTNTSMVTIADLFGRTLITQNCSAPAQKQITIQTENLPAGNYVLRAYSGGAVHTVKLAILK